MSVVGLFIGARLKAGISEVLLKKTFGWFVFIMGMIVLFDQVRHVME